jgi:hypothetical protein
MIIYLEESLKFLKRTRNSKLNGMILSKDVTNDFTTGSGRFQTSTALVTNNIFVSGSHQLLLLNYYPYIARFLAPHQREVN